MELKTDFEKFLREIRPTENQRADLQTGHQTLRDRLHDDEDLQEVVVSDFLQGSYRRATAVRPKDEKRSDVDIIVVTNLSEADYTPKEAMNVFVPFLDRHYKSKWKPQGRSFGIELSYVELDLVITSAPSEAQHKVLRSAAVRTDDDLEVARDWRLNESWVGLDVRHLREAQIRLAKSQDEAEWKTAPLRIPDRDVNAWQDTHPLEQIRWTRDKNATTNRYFVNVVKALKWWRLEKHDEPKHPKGFPLERLVGECCPDGIGSVAEGITRTLETIVSKYAVEAALGLKPVLPDYGVPSHDVFRRVTAEDFKAFYDQVKGAAKLARHALDSTDRTESGNLWRELLGSKFPEPPANGGGTKKVGYTAPAAPAVPGSGRFA
jgi:hypothetical protein